MNAKETRIYWSWVIFLSILFGLVLQVAEALADPYPRPGAYVGVRSGGSPLIKADGTIDSAICKQFARFPQVALDMNALLISPNIVPTLLHYNPGIEISGYHLTTHWFLKADFVVQSGDKSFDAYWHKGLQATGGFVPNAPDGFEVNWGKESTADELSRLLVWGFTRLRVRGFFGDYWNPLASWAQVGNEFSDQGRVENLSETVRLLRESQGPGFRVYGNGSGAELCGLDGTLVEGFPTAHFGTFAKAIAQRDGDWLKSEGNLTDKRSLRYMLGTACMTGATTSYGAQEVSPGGQTWPGTWWFDEYSVTPDGKPDPTGEHVGWLGEALGAYVKMGSGLYVRFFEHGLVIVNPSSSSITQQALWPNYKRIGQTTADQNIIVPAMDAVFLWGN